MSLELAIGIQVLALGIVLFAATPAIRRRAPDLNVYVALGRSVLIVGGVILIALPFIGTATPMTNTPNPVPNQVTSVRTGADLYQANCAQCHGVDARGGGPLANTTAVQPPSLRAHLSAHTDGDLFYYISNGMPGGMPAWSDRLSETDRWNVINYLRSLSVAVTPPPAPSASALLVPLALPVLWALFGVGFIWRTRGRRRSSTAPRGRP